MTKIDPTADHLQKAEKALAEDALSYLTEVDEYAKDGYRPRTCFHGTDLWTDYDNICGLCEEDAYDPRYHTTDSVEFTDEVARRASKIASREAYQDLLQQIKRTAENSQTRSDLMALRSFIDIALEV